MDTLHHGKVKVDLVHIRVLILFAMLPDSSAMYQSQILLIAFFQILVFFFCFCFLFFAFTAANVKIRTTLSNRYTARSERLQTSDDTKS